MRGGNRSQQCSSGVRIVWQKNVSCAQREEARMVRRVSPEVTLLFCAVLRDLVLDGSVGHHFSKGSALILTDIGNDGRQASERANGFMEGNCES